MYRAAASFKESPSWFANDANQASTSPSSCSCSSTVPLRAALASSPTSSASHATVAGTPAHGRAGRRSPPCASWNAASSVTAGRIAHVLQPARTIADIRCMADMPTWLAPEIEEARKQRADALVAVGAGVGAAPGALDPVNTAVDATLDQWMAKQGRQLRAPPRARARVPRVRQPARALQHLPRLLPSGRQRHGRRPPLRPLRRTDPDPDPRTAHRGGRTGHADGRRLSRVLATRRLTTGQSGVQVALEVAEVGFLDRHLTLVVGHRPGGSSGSGSTSSSASSSASTSRGSGASRCVRSCVRDTRHRPRVTPRRPA